MVHLDDLAIGKIARRHFGEPHHEHGADREVGHDHGGYAHLFAQGADLLEVVREQPACPDDGGDAAPQGRNRMLRRCGGMREIHEHVAGHLVQRLPELGPDRDVWNVAADQVEQALAAVFAVNGQHQLHIGLLVNALGDGLSHAAGGAGQSHANLGLAHDLVGAGLRSSR